MRLLNLETLALFIVRHRKGVARNTLVHDIPWSAASR